MADQTYTGTSPDLPVAFRYPAGWDLQEETGRVDVYKAVRLIGPRNDEDTYARSLVVRTAPLKREGGRHDTLAELVASYKARASSGDTVLSEGTRTVADATAADLTVSYLVPPLHHRGLVPKEIPVTTRAVLFEHDGRLYEVTYSADSREHARGVGAFEELLTSFRFQH